MPPCPGSRRAADRLVAEVVATTRALRDNELFVRIVELDAELLLPYLLTRRGRSQQAIAELTAGRIEEGQAEGSIRAGSPVAMARALLLAAHGFVLSAHTMVDDDGQRGRPGRRARAGRTPGGHAMSRGRIRAGLDGVPTRVDVLVVGLGVTGVGVALDAAARGLTVLAVDAHDLAFGTSRWSSKLVHGGLRYLANGQVGVAHESAVERGILMEVTAPHLTHALPFLLPLDEHTGHRQAALLRAGVEAGDWLRIAARTSRKTLPRPRRVSATESRHLAPVLGAGVRGGILSWDGQLEDDARLVATLARTAAGRGAELRTRARAVTLTGTGAVLRDELSGTTYDVSARAVVNAAGVWAGRAGRRRPPQPEPGHPPRRPRRGVPRPARRAHPAGARRPQPLPQRAAPARRPGLPRAHRRGRRRRGRPTCPSRAGPRSTSC